MTLKIVSKKHSYVMAKRKRTEKSKYKHQSTGDHCTCAAYVAEIMCMKYAEYKNVGSLPFKFWSVKPWDWTFKKQLIAANKIKIFINFCKNRIRCNSYIFILI